MCIIKHHVTNSHGVTYFSALLGLALGHEELSSCCHCFTQYTLSNTSVKDIICLVGNHTEVHHVQWALPYDDPGNHCYSGSQCLIPAFNKMYLYLQIMSSSTALQ
jgi:hypothetical protein